MKRMAQPVLLIAAMSLLLTAILHILLGLPAIIASIDNHLIRDSALMSSGEIKAMWVAFSANLVGVALIVVRAAFRRVDVWLLLCCAAIPLLAALCLAW